MVRRDFNWAVANAVKKVLDKDGDISYYDMQFICRDAYWKIYKADDCSYRTKGYWCSELDFPDWKCDKVWIDLLCSELLELYADCLGEYMSTLDDPDVVESFSDELYYITMDELVADKITDIDM